MAKQWHPLFTQLLRPLVEGYFDVQTNVPVGDVPREADLLLLHRTGSGTPPFQGLWRGLTTWNVVEYKGPTVSPRVGDLDLLMEVGLGIYRRLNEERVKQRQRPLRPADLSLWYLTHHLGSRFLRDAARWLGRAPEPAGPGLWRCEVLRRLVFLVSGAELPVEEDSLPLHLIGQGSPAVETALAHFLVGRPALWQVYGGYLASLHPAAWEEIRAMARRTPDGPQFDLRPAIEYLGLKQVIEQVGLKQVIDEVGLKEVINEVGLDHLLAALTPAQRRELKRRLQ